MRDQATYAEHIYQEYIYKHVNPLEQREEIVRCKGCMCRAKACCWCINGGADPNGFCAWGKKRGDNNAS